MGQQIVQDLAAAATSALNQAIPALLDNLNPIAKAKAGASAIGGIFHGGNDEKADTARGTQPAAAAQGAPQATTPASQYTPQKTQDPAYSAIIRVSTFLAALNIIIAGKDGDGNIDWDKAHGDGTKESGKSSIAFLLAMLNDARDTFAKVATEAEPSTELTDALKTCAKVIISLLFLAAMSHHTDRLHPRSRPKSRNRPMHHPRILPRILRKSSSGENVLLRGMRQQTRSLLPPRLSLGPRLMASPSWPTPLSRRLTSTLRLLKPKPYWSPQRTG
jgi:hypothetical protein